MSADGTKIVLRSDSDFLGQGIPDDQFEIWLYDTATLSFTRISQASEPGRDSGDPKISADGSKIVFRSDSDFLNQGIPDNQFEIWLYDTATMILSRITTASDASRDSGSPDINEDGTKIAFRSDSDLLNIGLPDDQFELWLYDTGTMTVTRITTGSDLDRTSNAPSLNADGSVIAFRSDSDFLNQSLQNEQFEIWMYNMPAMTYTRVTNILTTTRTADEPAVSADGTRVLFRSDADLLGEGIPLGQFEIWMFDTATMTLTRITTVSSVTRQNNDPTLSADGTKAAFSSDSDYLGEGNPEGRFEIWLVDLLTMGFTRFTAATSPGRDSGSPSLNADGSTLVFRSDSDFQGTSVMDDMFEIWLAQSPIAPIYRVRLPLVATGP